MLYAILCYNDQDAVAAWGEEQDAEVMARLEAVHQRLLDEGRLGPAARLAFTPQARTLRKGTQPPLVTDGPYVETKEAMLGFYIVDCADDEAAMDVARALESANPGVGGYEVRPIRMFIPGAGVS